MCEFSSNIEDEGHGEHFVTEFLFCKDEIAGISKNSIMFKIDKVKTTATIYSESDCRDKVENQNFTNFLDVRCT